MPPATRRWQHDAVSAYYASAVPYAERQRHASFATDTRGTIFQTHRGRIAGNERRRSARCAINAQRLLVELRSAATLRWSSGRRRLHGFISPISSRRQERLRVTRGTMLRDVTSCDAACRRGYATPSGQPVSTVRDDTRHVSFEQAGDSTAGGAVMARRQPRASSPEPLQPLDVAAASVTTRTSL